MKYKNYNDYELIYMVRENDLNSKDILYEKYEPILKSISRNFYNKYPYYGYDYDDFFQEAIIYFEKALIHYDECKESKLYSFVVLCVNRGLLSFCRKISNANKHMPSIYYIDLDQCNIADSKNDIDKLYQEKEICNVIKDTILDLPLKESSILELRYNGFNYTEISRLLGIPATTVEYRLRKIRKVLNSYCK